MAFPVLFDALFYGNAQHNRLIRLDTPLGEDWLVPMYAKGISKLGRDYEFVVDVASSHSDRITLKALIAQPVTLWLQQSDGDYLPHHGYVKSFSRLGSDGYLTFYQLRFSSWMCFLPLCRDMRDWQEQPGEQIVADVFDQHPQAQGAYRFDVRQAMPRYSNRVQWEDDWRMPELKAWAGQIAEQYGTKVPSQYLEGGGEQVIVDLGELANRITEEGEKLKRGLTVVPIEWNGVRVELRATNWQNVEDMYGYSRFEDDFSSVARTRRLGTEEIHTKITNSKAIAGARASSADQDRVQ